MQIERILCPVCTLGPGKRIVIWTNGCSKRCPNCISPELQQVRPDKNIPLPRLLSIVKDLLKQEGADGITISGGDPMEQADEVLAFIAAISEACRDILIYTGYSLAELQEKLSAEEFEVLQKHTAVLIDGRYIAALNDGLSPLIGSTNQQIHYFDQELRARYEAYMHRHGRQVQTIYYGDRMISIGIPNV